MTDADGLGLARIERLVSAIPEMQRTLQSHSAALESIQRAVIGSLDTGAPGLIEQHRDCERRLVAVEVACPALAGRIATVEAASGAMARQAWHDAAKIAGSGALGGLLALAGWLATKALHL